MKPWSYPYIIYRIYLMDLDGQIQPFIQLPPSKLGAVWVKLLAPQPPRLWVPGVHSRIGVGGRVSHRLRQQRSKVAGVASSTDLSDDKWFNWQLQQGMETQCRSGAELFLSATVCHATVKANAKVLWLYRTWLFEHVFTAWCLWKLPPCCHLLHQMDGLRLRLGCPAMFRSGQEDSVKSCSTWIFPYHKDAILWYIMPFVWFCASIVGIFWSFLPP